MLSRNWHYNLYAINSTLSENQDWLNSSGYKPTNLKGKNNYLSHPASIMTTGLCALHHAPHSLLQVSTKLELVVYKEQYMSAAQPETLNLPAVRSCARMSMILERCSGVSLQKRGRPRIACTLTCKFLWDTKLQGWKIRKIHNKCKITHHNN